MTYCYFNPFILVEEEDKEIIKAIYGLAGKGMVLNSPFSIGSRKEQIIQAFGPPNRSYGTAIAYSNRKEEYIFKYPYYETVEQILKNISDFDFTKEDIIEVLGEPTEEGIASITYTIGDFDLIFGIINNSVILYVVRPA